MSTAAPGNPPPPIDPPGNTPPPSQAGGRSAWLTHVKKTMRAHKGLKLKQVLKLAKKSYKKTRKTRRGGAGEDGEDEDDKAMLGGAAMTPAPTGGRRRSRKGSKKSKKGSRRH